MNLPALEQEVLEFWNTHHTFQKSIEQRKGSPSFTFYEGPPSANGMPGIHHVMARAIKDIFCRYQTLKGKQVKRKAGWDTHGLPVELQVEKKLGITKEDIGKKISVADYNKACREAVMEFTSVWDDLTNRMGYWVDLQDPYITYTNEYIESLWHLLKRLFDKNLLYKGYTIQPYSPAAGTGLSSHELNLPGCYRMVKDTSVVAQFKIKGKENEYFLAWTTTPWTLPSNTALAVGVNISYIQVQTFNPYTFQPVKVILAKELFGKYFSEKLSELALEDYTPGDKNIPWKIIGEWKGKDLVGMEYEQLLPYVQPETPAFRVIPGDFVTTEDGTGIVHIAPTFGSDDMRVAKQQGIPPLMVKDEAGYDMPLVDKQGRFVKEVTDFAGMFVKNYEGKDESDPDYRSTDVLISIKLKTENKAFKVEKYEHSYPHCWRTDKPVLYYPLDSWFIKTTAVKDRMVELNKTIHWKPESTGTGRFGNWLENLVDWNLSRSRYWGTPLPIWVSEDRSEIKCIGSIEELKTEVQKSISAGRLSAEILAHWEEKIDLHRPWVDEIVLVSDSGKVLKREPDLIDVWFDSGAMPFAQWHYPFENQELFKDSFPGDFIAEGVDQTRGWFFTLHAIAVLLEDSVAFRNVIANGLVLDKNGNKMSKRLGNAVDPFMILSKYGADCTRWYMVENAPPWENLKFNEEILDETRRKLFGTLFNTYSFFALYANIDAFRYGERKLIPVAERPESDQWIISLLHSLIQEADAAYSDYDPTRAARVIQEFAIEQLSNWFVRLSRRRFWKGEMTTDKQAAYETLYECLKTVCILMSPIAPFLPEQLYRHLTAPISGNENPESIHLGNWPEVNPAYIRKDLEYRMSTAQDICSLVRSLRRKVDLKIRQPLSRILIPASDAQLADHIRKVEELIRSEVNIKKIELITDDSGIVVKKAKPNFKALGPKAGSLLKEVSARIQEWGADEIREMEQNGKVFVKAGDKMMEITRSEVEILSEDIPGWSVAGNGKLTVALDISLTPELIREGYAREFVNRIQNLRKDSGLEVTDRINLLIINNSEWIEALTEYKDYICTETLAISLELASEVPDGVTVEINDIPCTIRITKVS
jgi:isoleucyl-tRNA synthetase